MNPSDVTAWFATALFPSTAMAGLVLRRFLTGAFAIRLRPHFILGYAVLALAVMHTFVAMPNARALSGTDLRLAALALFGLGLQTFVGMSLQAPGLYRGALRRWHVATTVAVAGLIAGHILLTI